MTLDEAIKHAEEVAEENQRVVDTGIVFNDVTIDMLYCDDTEVIEEHLANYQRRAEKQRQLAKWLKELKQLREQEPCEDCISRADARHLIAEVNRKKLGCISTKTFKTLYNGIDELPSVTPQSKTGHWEEYGHNISDSYIWDGVRCSVCKKDARVKTRFIKREPVIWDRDCFELTSYCPNCGAKMVEPQESEVEK